MAGGVASPQEGGASPAILLRLVLEIVSANAADGTQTAHAIFKKDCTDLVRRIALFTHLLEEIRDSGESSDNDCVCASSSSSSASSWSADLAVALQAAKRLVSVAYSYNSDNSSDGGAKRLSFQFQCIALKLEKALGKIPYDQYQISEEVQEQVSLVRSQLRRATERYGSLNSRKVSIALSTPLEKQCGEISAKLDNISENCGATSRRHGADPTTKLLERVKSSSTSSDVCLLDEIDPNGLENVATECPEETKNPDALVIPEDFLCPISLELMRDPVIVSTGQAICAPNYCLHFSFFFCGQPLPFAISYNLAYSFIFLILQTYERSCIQRWIACGNATCPKTQQKLKI